MVGLRLDRRLQVRIDASDVIQDAYVDALPVASSAAQAAQLLAKHTSPTQAAMRAERMLRLQEALNTLDRWTGKSCPCGIPRR